MLTLSSISSSVPPFACVRFVATLGWRLRYWGFAAAILCGAFAGAARAQPTEPAAQLITTLDQFWNTPASLRQSPQPVRFEFKIEYYDPYWKMIWGHCQNTGFYIAPGNTDFAYRAGQNILAEGTMVPAEGLSLANCRLNSLPDSPASAPIPATGQIDNITALQNQVVSVEGYVQRQSNTDEHHVALEILCGTTLVHGTVVTFENERLPLLLDTLVRISGYYIAKTTQSGKLADLTVWIPHLTAVQKVSASIDDERFDSATRSSIEHLVNLTKENAVVVRGTVYAAQSGKSITVRDGTGQVRILSPQTRSVPKGSIVEAVGRPSIQGNNWTLTDGFFRLISLPSTDIVAHEGPLRLAGQVLDLGRDQAAKGQPVKLSGVVTWVRSSENFIYLQDTSAGIRVQLPANFKAADYMINAVMEVTGTTVAGNFAPEVLADVILPLGPSGVPNPRYITLDQAMTGIEESQSVEMTGYLRDLKHSADWTELSLTNTSGEFTVRLPFYRELDQLKHATIRVAGVCVALTNANHELTGITLLTANQEFVQIEEPALADPFAIASRTIASLRLYSPVQSFNQHIRLVGQVIQHSPGHYLHIQDGAAGLLVLSRDTTPLQLGDKVEVSGIPGRIANRLVLREAVYRRVGRSSEPPPATLPESGEAVKDLDGRLVTAEGHLLEINRSGREDILLIQSKSATFSAKLEADQHVLPPLGAVLKITGVYKIDHDEYREPRSFHVELRSQRDIVVLEQPSWLTAGRALGIAGLLAAVVLLGFTWVTILRRRVRHQTALIREQLEKEATLEARHAEIVENASDFIFTLDQTGRFTSFNAAGEQITGYPRAEALNLNIRDLIAPDHAQEPLPIFDLQAELDGTVTFQTRFKSKDGRLIWIETNARLIRQHGRAPGILGVARDITARKQIEQELLRARDAAEANTKAKSAFLANMSHEIRTPMNGVIGMSNLLLHTPLNDEQRDFTSTIRDSAESLLTILNDILDFSKIEAGKLHFDSIDFDLTETVELTLELLAARASEKNIELACCLPQNLSRHIRGDPGRLRQILLNLLGNAVKFTSHGEVILALSVPKETDTDLHLLFEITDTGPGIDAATQATLFQPFQQADNSTTRKFGGTGLGLAISKQIVNLMEGQIGVRSTPGKGSIFWFTVRFEKQPQGPDCGRPPAPLAALHGMHTLIVDDNATNRKILQHYTAGWGLRSELAAGATAARELLRAAVLAKDPYKLILLDYQMPGIDGLTLAREIQADATLSDSRIVLLTSWDRRFTREELTEAGIIRMLVKPIRQQDLLNALLRSNRLGFDTLPSNSPLPPSSPLSRTLAVAADERTPFKTRSLHILVAEDNLVNQRVSRMQLKNFGHSVDIARNGLEVLELLERGNYDAIFMDCQMPELDGYDTTRRIRQHPVHGKIRIVAMTANAMQGDRERCLAAGMDDYVTKPTRSEDLASALARCAAALAPAGP